MRTSAEAQMGTFEPVRRGVGWSSGQPRPALRAVPCDVSFVGSPYPERVLFFVVVGGVLFSDSPGQDGRRTTWKVVTPVSRPGLIP